MEETLTPLRVCATPSSLGADVASLVLDRVARARAAKRTFLLGCPTGRTPRPVYAALAAAGADLTHVVLVMMDEYVAPDVEREPWSCHAFARSELSWASTIWFPDPAHPADYDARIEEAGGIDLFLLASGASDGHVAFNPPGSARDSRTRIISLSEETRRDNLLTFPAFGDLAHVPRQGVSVGIATIAAAREAVMMVWGASKRTTLARIRAARRYDPAWPATVVHECAARAVVCDADAAHGPD